MAKYFKLASAFSPLKFTATALAGGFLAYNAFPVAKMETTKDTSLDDSDKLLKENIHAKLPSKEFYNNVAIFSGNANKALAEEIASDLGTKLGSITVGRFNDGEVNIQVLDNVRGKDIFIVQPTSPPVNENLMELLLMVSTMRRASARKITIVVPYYGYSRQDRKVAPRVPISAADVARLLETMGVDRVIAIDLHCGQIQGFFGPRVPVDNLEANVAAVTYFKNHSDIKLEKPIIISPDAGGVARAKKFQELFKSEMQQPDTGLAMIIKHREQAGKVAKMHLVGTVSGSDVIIIDDLIDTAGTLSEAAKELKKMGAKRVYAFATHGLFSTNAYENINKSEIEQVIVTNTIPPRGNEKDSPKIKRLSIASLLAEAIRRVQLKESVSDLFSSQSKK